jgi:hypothetical protein
MSGVSVLNTYIYPLDLVGSKIMTVYVAEIEGRGTGAFHANNGSDAKRFARDRVFATISWSWRRVLSACGRIAIRRGLSAGCGDSWQARPR